MISWLALASVKPTRTPTTTYQDKNYNQLIPENKRISVKAVNYKTLNKKPSLLCAKNGKKGLNHD